MYCSCIHQVPLVTYILLFTINFCLPAERPHCRIWAVLKSEIISLWRQRYALLHSRRSVNFKAKDCVSHVPQCLAGMDKHVENSCKQRAECLHRSFVIIYTEHGQWQASVIREKSACLAEVIVTEQILWKFPNSQKSWGNWACANSVYQAFFLCPRMRAWERGYSSTSSM